MSENFTITDSANGYILDIDLNIQSIAWQNKIDHLHDMVILYSKRVFEVMGLTNYVNHIELSLLLTDNESIQKLNLQYRGKDSPTNSLSFPAQEIIAKKLNEFEFQGGFAILGDIIFAYEVIESEAKEQNKDFYNHFAHLLVHGILHLLGYDHQLEKEALEMEAIEIEILSFFNIQSPYESLN